MSLKIAYILGAGLGTRMGPIGEVLPKLLWPVYEKSLLELQVDYAIECGIEKIYINTHFQAEKIESFVKLKKMKIEVLHEEELLDIGGAIHNLARILNYEGQVLILNGDQFLMLPENSFDDFKNKSSKYVANLLGLKVPARSQYNELIVTDNVLGSIEKPSSESDYYTYSGISIINLNMLSPCHGVSKFFDSVADYKNEDIFVYRPEEYEYWDFGTTQRYISSMNKVLRENESQFKKFLIRSNAFDQTKEKPKYCYNALGKENSINLNKELLEEGYGNIVIEGSDQNYSDRSVVIYNEKVSKV